MTIAILRANGVSVEQYRRMEPQGRRVFRRLLALRWLQKKQVTL